MPPAGSTRGNRQKLCNTPLDAGLPWAWVLGDEIYGSDRRLRMDLERREQPFVLAIRSNEKLWAVLDKRLGQHAASRLAASLPARAWRRLSAGARSKGDRLYDWARLRLTRLQQPPWEHWPRIPQINPFSGELEAQVCCIVQGDSGREQSRTWPVRWVKQIGPLSAWNLTPASN